MKKFRACALLSLILTSFGCTKDSRVEELQKQLRELDKKIGALNDDVASLKSESSLNELVRNSEGVAYLTPGSSGFSLIKTDMGPVTVSLEDVRPYANGSRVVLQFGNPTSATFVDTSAAVDWGSVDKKGVPLNDAEQTKEVSLDKPLRPGYWNPVDVIPEGVPPASLGFIRIHDVKNAKIELFKQR